MPPRTYKSQKLQIGERYGRWIIIGERLLVESKKHKASAYLCKCDCGQEKVVNAFSLLRGDSTSCGCLVKEIRTSRFYKHGHSRERLYEIWRKMIARCTNPNASDFSQYGAKGIAVCDEWLLYEQFRDWSLTHGYEDKLTLDRINGTDSYKPQNCRWVTHAVQNRNTTQNVNLTAFGETKCAQDWVADSRCALQSGEGLIARIRKGWDHEKAITYPSQRAGKRK